MCKRDKPSDNTTLQCRSFYQSNEVFRGFIYGLQMGDGIAGDQIDTQ